MHGPGSREAGGDYTLFIVSSVLPVNAGARNRVTVRDAVAADAPAIQRIATAAWRDTYAGIFAPEVIERSLANNYSISRLAQLLPAGPDAAGGGAARGRSSGRGSATDGGVSDSDTNAGRAAEIGTVAYAAGGAGGSFWLIGELDAQPAGFCGAGWRENGVCELGAMYVEPPAQRRGLGRAMMQRVIGLARERGCRSIELDYAAANTKTAAFYTSIGFREYAREHVAWVNAQVIKARLDLRLPSPSPEMPSP
jgi:GNAT superfamily N-acetyltransferase